jgi:hypothetical protein
MPMLAVLNAMSNASSKVIAAATCRTPRNSCRLSRMPAVVVRVACAEATAGIPRSAR